MEKLIDEFECESLIERIMIDFKAARDNILEILKDFSQFNADKNIRDSMGSEYMGWLRGCMLKIENRLKDDFSIIVIGDFKRGKSTFINALLQEQVVVTNATPETVTINRVSYGAKNSIEAKLKDGRLVRLNEGELKRDALENIISRLPSAVEYIDIKVPVEALKGLRIVDTPGVGDILNRFDNQIKDYLVNADAVIYVVSALSPLSETEQNFICASILPQNFSRFFVVLNMIDCLEDENEIMKIKSLISSKLLNIFPQSHVYSVSSLDEYCRVKGFKRPNPALGKVLEEAFEEMKLSLQEDIITKRDILQTERCQGMAKSMIAGIEERVSLINDMIQLDENKLEELIKEYQDENSDLMKNIEKHKQSVRFDVMEMHAEAKEWMSHFLSRLGNEINSIKGIPLEYLEKYFHFYMIDIIRSAFIECTKAHIKNISTLLKNASCEFSKELTNFALPAASVEIAEAITDLSWTNMDAAAVALNFIPGIGVLTLIGQAIAGFVKQENTSVREKLFIDNVLNNYSQIKDSVFKELRNIYENIASSSLEQLDKIYQSQVSKSLEAVRQAQSIALREHAEKGDIKLGLQAAIQIIDSAKLKLAKY